MTNRARLRAAASNVREVDPSAELLYIGLEHVESGTGRLVASRELAVKSADSELIFRRGDVLFGKLRPYLAKVLAPDFDGCASAEFMVIRPKPDVDSRYLYYLCLSRPFLGWAEATSVGTRMPRTDWEALSNLILDLPAPARQRATVNFLDRETARIDDAIHANERLLGLIRLRKRAYADSLLRSGEYPVARVKSVVYQITSGPRGWSAHFSDEGRPFLRISNIARDGLDVSDVSLMRVAPPETAEAERTRVEDGDVVVSITADIGSVAMVSDQFVGGYVSQHLALLRPHQARIEPKWLALGLFGSSGQAQLDSARYGGTKTQLALDDVGDVQLPIPPLGRQRAALQRWSEMEIMSERLKAAIERQAALLGERRVALITAAVSAHMDLTQDMT